MKNITIQNRRPDDINYPTFIPTEINKKPLIVEEKDYLINSDGDIIVVTSGNKKYTPVETFSDNLNIGYFRAKYLGNPDDTEDVCGSFLGYANQVRKATKEQIIKALEYVQPKEASVKRGEQLSLI